MKITLDEIRSAVASMDAVFGNNNPFKVRVKGALAVAEYDVSMKGMWASELLKECRGLIFNADSGELLSRPYHKFFNVNENDWTQMVDLPWHEPHTILEKLDGSMIRPIVDPETCKLRFCTKAGYSDVAAQVDQWVAEKAPHITIFCLDMIRGGFTPIFEWCSRKMRIVIDHPCDRLVLTGIRDNDTGQYISYEYMKEVAVNLYGIEVVKCFDRTLSAEDFVAWARVQKGTEGFVVRWYNGLMVKVKTEDYMTVHHTLDILKSEKHILKAVVTDVVDDVVAGMRVSDRVAVLDYAQKVNEGINTFAREVVYLVARGRGTRKEFADYARQSPLGMALMRFVGSDKDAITVPTLEYVVTYVRDALAKSCGSNTAIENNRHMMSGVSWDRYAAGVGLNPGNGVDSE